MLGGDQPTYTLATVGRAVPAVVQTQLDAAGEAAAFGVEYLTVADAPAVEAAVREGDATVGLADTIMYVRTDAPGAFPVLVAQAVVAEETRGADARGRPDAAADRPAGIDRRRPSRSRSVRSRTRAARRWASSSGSCSTWASCSAASTIAMNVGMEKSTRIAEVLLAVLRPSQILVGNVIGIGMQTLVQLLVLAVPILVALTVADGLDLPSVAAGDIGLGVAWFVIGFVVYAFLFAATAALVDKMTEVGSAIMPVTIMLVLSYVGAVIMVPKDPGLGPERRAVDVPAHLADGHAHPMGVRDRPGLAAGAEHAAGASARRVLLAWFGSRVYRRALVVTGRRLKLREVLHERA